MPHGIDQDFLDLPLRALADAALARCQELGVEHADVRVARNRGQLLRLRDGRPEGSSDGEDAGMAVRVVHDGSWGFAASVDLTVDEVVRLADQAVEMARLSRPLSTERIVLAPSRCTPTRPTSRRTRSTPTSVPEAEKAALLAQWSRRLLAAPGVDHVDASVYAVKENTFYADVAGTSTTQQRVRIEPGGHPRRHRSRHRGLRHDAHDRSPGRAWLGVPRRLPLGRGQRLGLGVRAR